MTTSANFWHCSPQAQTAGKHGIKTVALVLACCAVWLAAPASHASQAMATKSDCTGCHAVAIKVVGPAFKDVAAKYAGQADAVELISQSIRSGGAGKWGELPMPTQSKLSPADTKRLAVWILSIK